MPEAHFRVSRFDSSIDGESVKGSAGRYDVFTVRYGGSLTVLEALFAIQSDQDPTLAFRYCRRASICGSCAMYIGGRYRLACQTNVRHVRGSPITVEPLPHMPLIRDLVCDMTDFFRKYDLVKSWLIRRSPDPKREILQSPKDRKKLNMPIDCIHCGCCYSSCPSVWCDDDYLGPAAMLKTYRFEVDSRDQGGRQRLPFFDNEHGAYRCHTIMNCAEACPKELSPTEGIQWLKRAAVRRRLFGRPK
jgi:succinate dehydrogenase / fumarate reductase, iron-sulfur subunit